MEIFNSSKSLIGNLTVISILLSLIFVLSSFAPKDYSIFSCPTIPISEPKSEKIATVDDLSAKLEKLSAGNNKTVIIAVINKAYVERNDDDQAANMFDLFLESFWLGEDTRSLINHLLIVAADQTAYERCVFRGLHCHLLTANQAGIEIDGPDSTGEQVYMSKGFIDFMWRRTFFLLTVLRKGYSFIFTDTDVMWLRNPFTRLDTSNLTNDIEFSTDSFNGNPRSTLNPINTGFYRVQSNNRTISLFEKWYAMRHKSSGKKEQDVLQAMVRKGDVGSLNISTLFLNTRYFSGFCQDSKDICEVVTVHANCCRYINAKVKDLGLVLTDWKRFKRLATNSSTNGTRGLGWSTHVNCRKSWNR